MCILEPSLPSVAMQRTMLCAPSVCEVIEESWSNHRYGRLRNDLELFVSGGHITVSVDPYTKPKSCYMAPLDPVSDCLWDIRSRDPKPGVRVIGAFAQFDTFIALDIEQRDRLGGPESREWRDFIVRAKSIWAQLFAPYKSLEGKAHELISDPFTVV